MKKHFYLFLLLPFISLAQIPDYYIGIDFTKNGQDLKEELSNLVIATHSTELVYTPGVWNALKTIDLDPDDSSRVLLIYGFDDTSTDARDHRTRDVNLSCHTSSCSGLWVREHTYPKSLGNPNLGTTGPGSDAHHIRPIDDLKNNNRSNRPFAEGSGNSYITSNGNFYPGDEWKGDVARMMMYMFIRYGDRCLANAVGSGPNTYSTEMPDIFLKWNAEDPPSEIEWVRNQVLEDLQGNRNPFIDNPYLATKIWGGDEANNTWVEMSLEDINQTHTQVYPNPVKGVLNIESNKNIESVSLYTLAGERVFSQNKLAQNRIDVSNMNNGTYLLLIYYTDQTKESKKVLVKK